MPKPVCSYPTCSQILTTKNEVTSGMCMDHLQVAVEKTAQNLIQKKLKEEYKENPPEYACLIIPHGADEDLKSISEYLWSKYHFEIGYCPENDVTFENLYYNMSERSYMGWVLEYGSCTITCQIMTKAYRSGGGEWQDWWEELLKNSEIVKCDKFY